MTASFKTCILGSFTPLRSLLRAIAEDRGHEVQDHQHPDLCPCLQATDACTFLIFEYPGAGDPEVIRDIIDSGRIRPADIAVLAFPTDEGVKEFRELGCHIIRQPFQVAELVGWLQERERRAGEM